MKPRSIWIGFDQREANAYAVAVRSAERQLTQKIPIRGVVLADLQALGLYTREMEFKQIDGAPHPVMWDKISDFAMSTQHAISRFFVPTLAKQGWALFTDGDFLFRSNPARLFDELDESKALYCVKHNHQPDAKLKMDGQIQSKYARKNWSSCMVFNCDHEANRELTNELLNGVPGRDLHRFCWLGDDDDLIGNLDPAWNWLVGHSDPLIDPKAVHFTSGVPDMAGYEDVPYADEWRDMLHSWARSPA